MSVHLTTNLTRTPISFGIGIATALTLLLSACMTTAPSMGGPMPPMEDRCNADLAKSAIGKAATAQVVEQARIDSRADIATFHADSRMVKGSGSNGTYLTPSA